MTDLQANCPKCGNKFATQAGKKSLCPKCLFEFVMDNTDIGQPTGPNAGKISDEPVLAEGTVIGQYKIINMIGRGGMGSVYKAHQPSLDRFVAIKILPAKLSADEDFVKRFNREARTLATLSHPNIIAIHDMGEYDKHYYFVMELVEGVTVRDLIGQHKLPPSEALKIVPQLCDALEYAHLEGIVHRDIKPENILLDKKGRVKIADFGLARIISGDVASELITKTQDIMGTYDYMSPEQRVNTKTVDHRSDIYSLGVVFYEMLTGELPIGKFELPSQKVSIDVRIDDVVMKSLAKEPSKRYQRANEVGTAVTEIISGKGEYANSAQNPHHMTEKGIMALILSLVPTGITQIAAIILGFRVRLDAKHDKNLSEALYLSTGAIGIGFLWLVFGFVFRIIPISMVLLGFALLIPCILIYYIRYGDGKVKYSGMAISSFILSFIPIIITQILGIIFGILAIRKINRSEGKLAGKGYAISGIIISILVLIGLTIAIIFGNVQSSISVAESTTHHHSEITIENLRKLAIANELYRRADLDKNNQNDYASSVKSLVENSVLQKVIFNTPEQVVSKGTYDEHYKNILGSGNRMGSYVIMKGDKLIAQADQETLGADAKPYNGYFYRSIPASLHDNYAFAAYPDVSYSGKLNNKTYIIDKRGIIYSKNMGNLKYPDKWDLVEYDPTKNGWKVETRVEINDSVLENAYQQIKKVQSELPEKILSQQEREAEQKQLAKSLEVAQTIKDVHQKSNTIAMIATNYAKLGEYDTALEITSTIEDDNSKGYAVQQLTALYANSKPKSTEILAKSLEIAKTMKDVRQKGNIMADIAIKYARLEDYDTALKITSTIEDDNAKGYALGSINNLKAQHK